MEKILEYEINQPLPALRKKIDKRLAELAKQYKEKKKRFAIDGVWSEDGRRLRLKSDFFQISCDFCFYPKRLVVYAQMPFLLRLFQKQAIRGLKKEMESLIK